MSQQDIRVGVVGCGAIFNNHVTGVKQANGAVLAAICDEVPEKAEAKGKEHGVPYFSSFEEMLPHVDAVNICVPSGLHAKLGVLAAQAGKHVLVEKPVDITYQAAKALVDACESAGVKHACISQHRFASAIQKAREMVQSGALGTMVQGDAYIKWYRTQAYYDSGDWRGTWALDGGGCLMNQGVHYVDMIQWVMGGVKAVRAITRTMAHNIEVEDVACSLIEYNNGAIGVIQGSTSAFPGLSERFDVHGKHGSIIIEGDKVKLWEIDPEAADLGPYGRGVLTQPTPSVHVLDGDKEGTGAADPSAIWGEQHNMQIQDFISAIHEDRDAFVTTRDALEPLKVILAIYESSRRGGERVEVAEMEA